MAALRSFCIKMPLLHRLACFRDDVVFLVFLYQVRFRVVISPLACADAIPDLQRWIYRIDPKRVNEYGQVLASEVDAVQANEGKETAETKKNK